MFNMDLRRYKKNTLFSAGLTLMSEFDVHRRSILTSKVGPRAERVNEDNQVK